MRNFAQRNVSRPGDMLHRDSRAPGQQRRGDEWVSVMDARASPLTNLLHCLLHRPSLLTHLIHCILHDQSLLTYHVH